MAISTEFQTAINLVDATKVLTFTVDPAYEDLEWSYNGLAVTGGSDIACELGAAALLEAMGFRFYAPNAAFWKLPVSIATGLSASKQTNWIPSQIIFLVYGHSWAGTNVASRDLLNNAYARWRTLNGAGIVSHPGGHRWRNVIDNNKAFFDANPVLLRPLGSIKTFALDRIIGTANWDNLVHLCAAFLLQQGLNEFNRTHFDPVDGDNNFSDHVYPFSKAVAAKMRAGTTAIGGIPAQAGVPDASIGVYAYAGHRLPPSQPYKPGVYTQVALAFNSTGLTFLELIKQHGALAEDVAIREYLDTQVWSQGNPMANGRAKRGYLASYDDYRAAGVESVVSEFTANWLVNIVLARSAILKFRTGTLDHEAVVSEIVNDVFGGDTAVKGLYDLWTNPLTRFHKWSLRESFDFVNAMAEGWYKQHYKRQMVILYKFLKWMKYEEYGIIKNPGGVDDTYGPAAAELFSMVTAVRDDDTIHSYAFIRQQANSKVSTEYPHLWMYANPEPDWFANPVAPTDADFVSQYNAIQTDAARDSALDGTDFVIRTVHPVASVSKTPATRYYCEGVAQYIYIGPGTVTMTDLSINEASTATYKAGVHSFDLVGKFRVEWNGGMMFLDTFPEVRKDFDGTNLYHWLFVPTSSANAVDLKPVARWTFFDQEGQKDWTKLDVFPGLGPGQVAVNNSLTRNNMQNSNCNRYLSAIANTALMSRELATREGGAYIVTKHIADPEGFR